MIWGEWAQSTLFYLDAASYKNCFQESNGDKTRYYKLKFDITSNMQEKRCTDYSI